MVIIIKIVKLIFWDEHDPPVMVGEWDGKHGLAVYHVSYPITIQWGPKGLQSLFNGLV